MPIIAYTQRVLDMEDLFGTKANKVGILTFIEKKVIQKEVGYRLLNVT